MQSSPFRHPLERIQQHAALFFSLRFLMACIVLFVCLEAMPEAFFHPINRLNTLVSSQILSALGMKPMIQGLMIVLNGFKANVIGECSAVFIAVLPLSFIFAYPARLLQKLCGGIAGLLFLSLINFFRIAILVYIGAYHQQYFEMVHIYMGQPAMVLVVLAICLGWIQWLQQENIQLNLFIILIRCLVLSAIGFFLWIFVSAPYSKALYQFLQLILPLFQITVAIPATMEVYPDTFQCINMVTFSALYWGAGRGRITSRVSSWLSGIAVLMLIHLLFKLLQVLFFQQHLLYLFQVINVLLVLNEWILPFGLWVFLARKSLFTKQVQG